MGAQSIAFLDRLVREAVAGGRDAVPKRVKGRGRVAVALAEALFDGIASHREFIQEAPLENSEKQDSLLMLSVVADLVHETLTPILARIETREIPAGVLYLVDELVTRLLGETADPVIYASAQVNFSVLSLIAELEEMNIFEALGMDFGTEHTPIVLTIPDLRVQSVLLAPLLVHEIGHVAVTGELLDLLEVRMRDQIDTLLEGNMENLGLDDDEAREEVRAEWQNHMMVWAEELVCDAYACAVTGPSALFALSVFLPAPGNGELGSHPFSPSRIALALQHLEALGWSDVLASVPQTLDWLKEVAQAGEARAPGSAKEEFLRGGVALFAPHLLELATMASPWRLEAGAFEGRRTELGSRFSDVVPPCQLRDGEATPTWDVVLSAWLHQLSPPGLGDSPDSLVSAASDDEFGRFVLKTIELSRVLDQWRQYELAEA